MDVNAPAVAVDVADLKIERFMQSEAAGIDNGQIRFVLRSADSEFEPKANKPTPGSADVCFITSAPIPEVILHLEACGVELLEVKPKNEKST